MSLAVTIALSAWPNSIADTLCPGIIFTVDGGAPSAMMAHHVFASAIFNINMSTESRTEMIRNAIW